MLKKLILILIAISLTATPLSGCTGSEEMSERSTMEFVSDMGLGINLGNTFDSTGEYLHGSDTTGVETAWGSPVVTKKMIKGYADGGFGVMRLPVSWTTLMDKDGNIPKEFIDRIDQVVGWILDSGMYCILNSHHDGWEDRFYDDRDGAMETYEKVWTQIAERFNKYGERLMFESMNEVGFNELWNQYGGTQGKQEAFDIFNAMNQKFVDVVRASGGNNAERHLLIASYWTNIDYACDELYVLPDDPAGRLAVSVHYYTPSVLTLIDEDVSWGKAKTDWGSEEDYAELNMWFDMLTEHFIDKGIPVIVGEYGCFGDNKTREVIEKWTLDVADAAYSRQICPILWDTPGGEYDRENCRYSAPEFIKKLIEVGEKRK